MKPNTKINYSVHNKPIFFNLSQNIFSDFFKENEIEKCVLAALTHDAGYFCELDFITPKHLNGFPTSKIQFKIDDVPVNPEHFCSLFENATDYHFLKTKH